MQVQWEMDVFTLRIHMYNIIDGIVGTKFGIFLQMKGTNFNPFSKHQEVWYCVVNEGGWGGREGGSQGNEVYNCVSGLHYLAPNHFANV